MARVSAAAIEGSSPRRLVRSGVWYAIATAAPMLSALAVTPLVTRSVGATQYGHVATFVVGVQLGQIVLALGAPAAITRRVAMDRNARGSATALCLACAIVALVIALVGAGGALLAGGTDGQIVAFTLVGSALLAGFTCAQALSRGLGEVGRFVVQAISLSLGAPLVGLALLLVTAPTVEMYLTGMVTVQGAIAASAVLGHARRSRHSLNASSFAEDLRLGAPTIPHQLASVAATALLVIVARVFDDPASAGELQLAILAGSVPMIVLGALNNSWATQFYEQPRQRWAAFLRSTTRLVMTIGATGSLCMAFASPLFVGWLAAPGMELDAMARCAALVAASAPLMVLYLANIHVVFGVGRTRPLALMTPTSLGAAMAAGWLMQRQTDTLTALALGVMLFYALQALAAFVLRRGCGDETLGLGWITTTAIAVAGVTVGVAAVSPSDAVRVTCFVTTAAAGLILVARQVRGGIL